MPTIILQGQTGTTMNDYEKRMSELMAKRPAKVVRMLNAGAVVNNLALLRSNLEEMGPLLERKCNAAVLLSDVCNALQLTEEETSKVLGFTLTDDMLWDLALGDETPTETLVEQAIANGKAIVSDMKADDLDEGDISDLFDLGSIKG